MADDLREAVALARWLAVGLGEGVRSARRGEGVTMGERDERDECERAALEGRLRALGYGPDRVRIARRGSTPEGARWAVTLRRPDGVALQYYFSAPHAPCWRGWRISHTRPGRERPPPGRATALNPPPSRPG